MHPHDWQLNGDEYSRNGLAGRYAGPYLSPSMKPMPMESFSDGSTLGMVYTTALIVSGFFLRDFYFGIGDGILHCRRQLHRRLTPSALIVGYAFRLSGGPRRQDRRNGFRRLRLWLDTTSSCTTAGPKCKGFAAASVL
jgi:hypothetical protein